MLGLMIDYENGISIIETVDNDTLSEIVRFSNREYQRVALDGVALEMDDEAGEVAPFVLAVYERITPPVGVLGFRHPEQGRGTE